MAGLVPAIHASLTVSFKDVDDRHKAGHDDFQSGRRSTQFQCTADHTFFLVKYMSPASTIRKIMTWKPMRLRATRCGSAAHIRKAEISLEYCCMVCGAPSSKVTCPAWSGGGIAMLWPGKYLLKCPPSGSWKPFGGSS